MLPASSTPLSSPYPGETATTPGALRHLLQQPKLPPEPQARCLLCSSSRTSSTPLPVTPRSHRAAGLQHSSGHSMQGRQPVSERAQLQGLNPCQPQPQKLLLDGPAPLAPTGMKASRLGSWHVPCVAVSGRRRRLTERPAQKIHHRGCVTAHRLCACHQFCQKLVKWVYSEMAM